jgi:curved DNA-binding protein CbpA
MSLKINGGLFEFDFTDYHAILGVSVNADFKEIRKRYLQIARHLHPDSCTAESSDKQRASQMLSKLVNPAYEKFSKDGNRAEYILLLKEMSKRLVQDAATIKLQNELSQQLNQTNNIDHIYKTSLQKLAEIQYDSFDQALQMIGQISELNLVYLMRKGVNVQLPPPQANVTNPGSHTTPSPPSQPETVVEQYYRRAQLLIEKNNFAQARVELQDALKLEPHNSLCHSLIGVVYLKQNQTTMAKVHINKALQLNPKDPMALKGKKFLDQLAQKSSGQSPAPSKATPSKPSGGTDNSGGSGLFGGLFGGKKK